MKLGLKNPERSFYTQGNSDLRNLCASLFFGFRKNKKGLFMTGSLLFDKNLLALRERVMKHPLCSSENRNYLAKLTAAVMFRQNPQALSQLIKIVNSLNQKFTVIKPTWSKLAWETQRTLTSIFEDKVVKTETKNALLNDLYRLSQEPNPEKYKRGIEKISAYCDQMEQGYRVLRPLFA